MQEYGRYLLPSEFIETIEFDTPGVWRTRLGLRSDALSASQDEVGPYHLLMLPPGKGNVSWRYQIMGIIGSYVMRTLPFVWRGHQAEH